MELGMAGSGPLRNRDSQFHCEPDTSMLYRQAYQTFSQQFPVLKSLSAQADILESSCSPDIFALIRSQDV